MKKLSCGVIVIDHNTRKLLVGHTTGQAYWDLFKGGMDDGETPAETARRELFEEAGIRFDGDLIDLGVLGYTPKKDLHLFIMEAKEHEILPETLECTTFVTPRHEGQAPFPEMDKHAWMTLPEFLGNSSLSMNALFKKLGSEGKLPIPWEYEWGDIPCVGVFRRPAKRKP